MSEVENWHFNAIATQRFRTTTLLSSCLAFWLTSSLFMSLPVTSVHLFSFP